MGKKQKDEIPNVNATPNRDIIQRLNFLYQASVYLQSLEPPIPIIPDTEYVPSSSGSKNKGKGKESQVTEYTHGKKKHTSRRNMRKIQTTGDLARSYVQCMRLVEQKTTVKM